MRKLIRRAVFVLAAVFIHNGAAAKTYTLNASSSKMRVVDGDTVHYGNLKFRLCGIQAPEHNQPYYRHATRMLKRLLGKGQVRANVVYTDKYRRKVAVMFAAKGVSVDEQMVRQGGAKHYKRYSAGCEPFVSPARLDAAEERARKKRRGIWKK